MAHRNSWFTYSEWWLSKCFVCLPEGVEFTITGKHPWSIVYPISSDKSHYYYFLVVIMYYLLLLYPSIIHCPIWVNYNNSLTWIKAIWGWFPLFTMIPVRENSEVAVNRSKITNHLQSLPCPMSRHPWALRPWPLRREVLSVFWASLIELRTPRTKWACKFKNHRTQKC